MRVLHEPRQGKYFALRTACILAASFSTLATADITTPLQLLMVPQGQKLKYWQELERFLGDIPSIDHSTLKPGHGKLELPFYQEPVAAFPLFEDFINSNNTDLIEQLRQKAPNLAQFLSDVRHEDSDQWITKFLTLLHSHEGLLGAIESFQGVASHQAGTEVETSHLTWSFLHWLALEMGPSLDGLLQEITNPNDLLEKLYKLHKKLSSRMLSATAEALQTHPEALMSLFNDNDALVWLQDLNNALNFNQNELVQQIIAATTILQQAPRGLNRQQFLFLILLNMLDFRQPPFTAEQYPLPDNYPNTQQVLQQFAVQFLGDSISLNPTTAQLMIVLLLQPGLLGLLQGTSINTSFASTENTLLQLEIFLATVPQANALLSFLLENPKLLGRTLLAAGSGSNAQVMLTLLHTAIDSPENFSDLLDLFAPPEQPTTADIEPATHPEPFTAENQASGTELVTGFQQNTQTQPAPSVLDDALKILKSQNKEENDLLVITPQALPLICQLLACQRMSAEQLSTILYMAAGIIAEMKNFNKRKFMLLLLARIVDSGLSPFTPSELEKIRTSLANIVRILMDMLASEFDLDQVVLQGAAEGLVIIIQQFQNALLPIAENSETVGNSPAMYLLPHLESFQTPDEAAHIISLLMSNPNLIALLNQFAFEQNVALPGLIEQLIQIPAPVIANLSVWQIQLLIMALTVQPVPSLERITETPNPTLLEVITHSLQTIPLVTGSAVELLTLQLQVEIDNVWSIKDKEKMTKILKKLLRKQFSE